MQPDPTIYLTAIRRELLAPEFFTTTLQSGLAPILAMRAGETLAHMALHDNLLPPILRALKPRQLALLADLQAALGAAAPQAEPADSAIAEYENLATAIGACISLWSREYPAAGLAPLCTAAARIEHDMRQAYNAALATLKADAARADAAVPLIEADPTAADLTQYLKHRFPAESAIEITEFRRLPGTNSKDIYLFNLHGLAGWPAASVLRREPAINITQAAVANEYDLLQQLHESAIPVPRVLLAERDPAHLGGAFLIMERSPGATYLPTALGESGPRIVAQIARHMAAFHNIDVHGLSDPYRPAGGSLRAQMLAVLDRYYARWVADRTDPAMALEAGFAWMRANVDCLGEDLALVHGDCNFRNILLADGQVTVFLDWELAHAGHAAEDLGYIRADVEKIMPWPEFMALYLSHGGRPVSDAALHYFQVWSNVWRTSMAVSASAGFARGEHRNFIFATVACHEYYNTLDDLCAQMIDP